MSTDPREYGASSDGEHGPDIALQQRAIDTAKTHPLYREAAAHVYCEPIVLCEPKTFMAETRYSDNLKRQVAEALASVDRVVLVSFHTSETIPETLSGGGTTYNFFLHPDSMEIICSATGSWRS
jgi:hypothetical protein